MHKEMRRRRQPRTWIVPGHTMWRARRIRRAGNTVAIRARHRVLVWNTITVETRDLRAGAEAVARELQRRSGRRHLLS
jgi:hypothetical protein